MTFEPCEVLMTQLFIRGRRGSPHAQNRSAVGQGADKTVAIRGFRIVWLIADAVVSKRLVDDENK
jgi:hypothetical protein